MICLLNCSTFSNLGLGSWGLKAQHKIGWNLRWDTWNFYFHDLFFNDESSKRIVQSHEAYIYIYVDSAKKLGKKTSFFKTSIQWNFRGLSAVSTLRATQGTMLCSLGFLPGNCVASCLDAIRPLYDFYMVEKNKPIKSMSVWRLFQDSWELVT